MKKTILVLGYIFLVLVALFAVTVGIVAVIGHSFDKESKAYVDTALPAIMAEWDVREIQKRASPEFEETVDYDELTEFFSMLKELGPLMEYKGSVGDSNITISLQGGYQITADYTANAEFEAGSAEVQLALIRHGKQWQILDLQIKPEEYSHGKDII